MWGSSGGSAPRSGSIHAGILAALFAVVAGLIFFGIYLVLPDSHHFWALIAIGIVALIFALLSYVAQGLSRRSEIQRGFAWGFIAFGMGVMFLSVLAFPVLYPNDSPITLVGEVIALILLVLVTIVVVGGSFWRTQGRAQDQRRQEARAAWQSRPPPSAFSYATGQSPQGPGAETGSPPPSGGQ